MNVFLGLILLLVLGYLGSHLTEQTKRYSLAMQSVLTLGAGFLITGLIIGPQVSGIITASALHELSPVIGLGLGWMGLLVGMQYDWRLIRQIPRQIWTGSLIISLLTIAIVFTCLYGFGLWQTSLPVFPVGFCLCLACAASLSDYSAMVLIKNMDSVRGGILKQIQLLTDIRIPIAVIIMSLWYSIETALWQEAALYGTQYTNTDIFHQADFPITFQLIAQGLVWFITAVLLGVTLGWLLHYLTSERLQPNEMLLVLTGTVVLSSGLAAYIYSSPLFVNFIMGITLTNLPNMTRGRVSNRLMQTERPFFIVFMLITGALWNPASWFVLIVTGLYIVCRLFALWFSVSVTQRVMLNDNNHPLFLAMLSQGGMSLAMVVVFYLIQSAQMSRISYHNPGSPMLIEPFSIMALNIIIISLLLNQILGANTLRYLLRRAGALQPGRQRESKTDSAALSGVET